MKRMLRCSRIIEPSWELLLVKQVVSLGVDDYLNDDENASYGLLEYDLLSTNDAAGLHRRD